MADKLVELGGMFNKVPKRLLLAYSGGLDSSVLLHLLHELRTAGVVDVAVAYYDHGWRGAPPPELGTLHKQCHSLGLSLILLSGNRTTPKTEASAREVRYTALVKLAQSLKVDAILTAHHADDQVETILFRLFRGTGIDGLKGILPRWVPDFSGNNAIPVLRPLLDWTRQQLYDYATRHQLRWFEDPTNQDTQFSRNAIRQQLLPMLDQHFPTARLSLLRLSQVLGSDADIVAETMESLWQRVYSAPAHSLKRRQFNALGEAYQRRILKRFLDVHGIESTWSLVDKALRFVRGERPQKPGRALNRPQLFSLPSSGEQADKNLNRRYLSIYNPIKASHLSGKKPDAENQLSEIQIITLTKKALYSPRLLPPVQPEVPVPWPVVQLPLLRTAPEEPTASDDLQDRLLPTEAALIELEADAVLLTEEDKPIPDEGETVSANHGDEDSQKAHEPTPKRTWLRLDIHAPFLRKTLTLREFSGKRDLPFTAKEQLVQQEAGVETVWVNMARLEAHLNTEDCEQRLVLRTRRPGDRFQPIGMSESLSLKTFLINRKLPHHERANRLLLVLASKSKSRPDEVLWIPGVEISDWLKVSVTETGAYVPTHQLSLHPMALRDLFATVPAYHVLPYRDPASQSRDFQDEQPRFNRRRHDSELAQSNASAALGADPFMDNLRDDFEVEQLLDHCFPPWIEPMPEFAEVKQETVPPLPDALLPDAPELTEPVRQQAPEQTLATQEQMQDPKRDDSPPQDPVLLLKTPLSPPTDTLAHLLGL